jgi:sulfatase maturation enzyme AslB (radical SAM superfamily)
METKCAAFWTHTNIRSSDRVFPCCRFKTPIAEFDGNLEQVLHHKSYEELRMKSVNNEFISGCEKCYHEEAIGKNSLRQDFNNTYSTDNISLQFLEIGFDNICNLTCDGCWEEFSSSWGKKIFLLKSEVVKSTKAISSIPNSINKVLFLGGEPLMTSRHKSFLSKFRDLSNLEVIYNTNGTFLLDQKTIDLLQKCKIVKFIVSIDGYNKLNDKVRVGSSWQKILDFLQQIKDLNFHISIHTVIHLNNWIGLKDLSIFVNHNKLEWTTNILTYPKPLDINNFQDKHKLINYLEEIENLPNKDSIINHLKI